MNKIECFSIKISSRILGVIILAISLLLAFIGTLLLPVVGLLFALPLLILAGVLLLAPESKTCRFITS